MTGLVLSLFDLTGNMVKPWADAGYDTLCIDQQRDGTDILRWLPPRLRQAEQGPLWDAAIDRGWDESCMLNAVLVWERGLSLDNGRVIHAYSADEPEPKEPE